MPGEARKKYSGAQDRGRLGRKYGGTHEFKKKCMKTVTVIVDGMFWVMLRIWLVLSGKENGELF